MDRIDAMQAFVAVVEAQGFAGAARKLGRSTAMVSRLVSALEAHLGARLLNRSTRKVAMTETGRAYYERAHAILAELDEADAEAGRDTTEPRGLLRVNAPVSFGILHLASALNDFKRLHADVQLDVVLNDRRVDLLDEGFDVVIRIGALADSSLIARPLATTRMVVCASPAYVRRHGRPKQPEDLQQHDCLIYTAGAAGPHDQWRFTRAGREWRVPVRGSYRASNGDLLLSAAQAGLGIIVTPSFNLGDRRRIVRLLTDYDAGTLPIHALYPHRRHLSAKVRRFVEFLAARYAGVPPWDRD